MPHKCLGLDQNVHLGKENKNFPKMSIFFGHANAGLGSLLFLMHLKQLLLTSSLPRSSIDDLVFSMFSSNFFEIELQN